MAGRKKPLPGYHQIDKDKIMSNPTSFIQSLALPVMPEVAHALIRTLNSDDADVATVTAIIAKDPGLTATLLRMANSAMFGLSRSVYTLDSAISVIGMAHIRARALFICMANGFVFPLGMERLDFWRYSMVCAGYSKWLASRSGVDEQEAWLAGMMLRLGQVMIAQRMPDTLEQIEAQPCAPGERWDRERLLTGFDEGQIAAEIARRWDFPETVANALAHATQPALSKEPCMSAVVHLAALITDMAAENPKPLLQNLPQPMLKRLALEAEKLQIQMPDAESFSDISMLLG